MANFFTGSPATSQQFPVLSPQQLNVKGAASNQALRMLQNLGGATGFEPIAQRAKTQFNTQTVPSIAERFTSLGGGAQRSSAFPALLGQQAAGLEEGLAGLQSQHGMELLKLLLGTSLSPEVETGITPESEGGFGSLLKQLLPYLGPLLGGLFGGPGGAAIGGALGGGVSALSNIFGSQPQSQARVNLPNYGSLIGNTLGNQPSGLNLPNYQGLISGILGGQ